MQSKLVSELIKGNCLKYGECTLKNGDSSNYYIDFRESTLRPKLFTLIVKTVISTLRQHVPELNQNAKVSIVGVPYGVVPIAAAVAYELGCSYVPLRKEAKAHGKEIDFSLLEGHRFILIEDVMSTGSSIVDAIKKLNGNITDIVVLANREAGGEESLNALYPNIKVHSILRAAELLKAKQDSF